MLLHEKIVYAFNKFYGNFLKDVKNCSPEIKATIRKHYKVVDKSSEEHLTFFGDQVEAHLGNYDPSNEALGAVEIFKEVALKDVLEHAPEGERGRVLVWNYLYILAALLYLHNSTDDAEANELLFNKVIQIIGIHQRGEDTTAELEDVLDDDIKGLLTKLVKVEQAAAAPEEGGSNSAEDLMGMFSDFEGNKICKLAKEISSEIDVSKIKVDSPDDLMKMLDFSGSNNVLGDIIGKMSSKIQDKVSSGELKHEELLSEAMSMMSMMGSKGMGGLGGLGGLGNMAGLFNNPMMADMMKNMKKGKVAQKTDVVKREQTRDKLRRKLEERRTNADS